MLEDQNLHFLSVYIALGTPVFKRSFIQIHILSNYNDPRIFYLLLKLTPTIKNIIHNIVKQGIHIGLVSSKCVFQDF